VAWEILVVTLVGRECPADLLKMPGAQLNGILFHQSLL
jgi:hypothetical protein